MNTTRALKAYLVIALLYTVIKIVFVSAGYLHIGAIAHGAVPTLLMGGVGLLALKSARDYSRLMLVLPILLFLITPPFMYFKQGAAWLDEGRLPVLIIYEVMAISQIFIARQLSRRRVAAE